MSTTLKAHSDPAPIKIGAGRVLVTGGTGFLGSAVLQALARQGSTPLLFRRPMSDLSLIEGVPRTEIVGDLDDLAPPPDFGPKSRPTDAVGDGTLGGGVAPLAGALRGCGAVIHCAAVTEMAGASEVALERINVQATARLAALCRQAGVQRFVYVSSVGTIGPVPGGIADETAPFTMAHNRYFASKSQAEEAVFQEWRQGLPAVIVNPTNMLGAAGLSANQQRLIRQAVRQPVCVTLPGGACFVSVDDVADGILRALEVGIPGQRYILGGENLTFCEYARLVASLAERRPILWRLPAPLFRAIVALGRLVGPLAPLTALRDPSAVDWLSRNTFYSSRKAIEQLGYRITPLPRVLPTVIARYG